MASRTTQNRSRHKAMVLELSGAVTFELCDRIEADLNRGEQDPSVTCHILSFTGQMHGFALDEPDLTALAARFGGLLRALGCAEKPISATLSGAIADEALDMALCAQRCLAHPKATLRMGGAELGLIPGGGATQTLPHLIGPKASLALMLSGQAWPITDPRLTGLAEIVTDPDLLAVATDPIDPPAPSHQRTADPAAFQAALTDARARYPKPTRAQADIIDCVEAAQLLPLDQGLAFEAARFAERAEDRLSRLLRHAARAQRAARDHAHAHAAPTLPIQNVVAMGRSSETADLAGMALEQGYLVWIEAGTPHMGQALADLARKRVRPSHRGAGALSDRLHVDLTGTEMENADLILDTCELTPDPPVALKTGAVWIVTSPDVAAADRALEVHGQGRTLRMRRLLRASHLVELSAPPGTPAAAIATAHTALSGAGQSVVVTADVRGGLLGALFCALARAALGMLAAGRDPGEIEHGARALGLRQGPLQMIDVLGAGRALAQMRRVYAHRAVSLAPLRLLSDRMADVTEGDEMRARRALVFHAPSGQSFVRDPDLAAWLKEWREDHPDQPGPWPDVAPRQALLAALVSEAARLLQSDVVPRASDIDLAAVQGLLMDARAGGPLIQADLDGMLGIARTVSMLNAVDPAVWARETLIDDMVKNGRRFF